MPEGMPPPPPEKNSEASAPVAETPSVAPVSSEKSAEPTVEERETEAKTRAAKEAVLKTLKENANTTAPKKEGAMPENPRSKKVSGGGGIERSGGSGIWSKVFLGGAASLGASSALAANSVATGAMGYSGTSATSMTGAKALLLPLKTAWLTVEGGFILIWNFFNMPNLLAMANKFMGFGGGGGGAKKPSGGGGGGH